jgi:hypothetical protein
MRAYVIGLTRIPSSFDSAIQVYTQLKEFGLEAYFHEGTYGDEVEEIFEQEGRELYHTSFKVIQSMMNIEPRVCVLALWPVSIVTTDYGKNVLSSMNLF